MISSQELLPPSYKGLESQSDLSLQGESSMLIRSIALLNLMSTYIPGLPEATAAREDFLDIQVFEAGATERMSAYEDKLKKLGLTPNDHVNIYADAFVGNMNGVKKVIGKSEKRMNRKRVKASLATEDPESMAIRHRQIVDALTRDIPRAEDIGEKQKVMIIAGPFAGGKSEILERMDTKNMVVIDLDVIRKMLSTDYDPTNQQDIQREREESWKVSDLLAIEAVKQGKTIVMQTALHRRSRWLKDPTITYANDNGIPIEICMILRPVTDCMNRNIHRERSVTMQDQFESMNGMDVLIKFVQKYRNVKCVKLVDFYPLIKNTHLMSPRAFQYQYNKLIEYARKRTDIFKIHTSISDLGILPE